MKNPLTTVIETRIGAYILIGWAAMFVVAIVHAEASYENLLTNLQVTAPTIKTVQRVEKDRINHWINENDLNAYGDPDGTAYPEGVPQMLDTVTGEPVDRYAYLRQRFPDKPWKYR